MPKVVEDAIVAIDSVSPDPANARSHDDRNITTIQASLRRFGQLKPIVVDANNVIRAGNGLWRAAKGLGWTEIWAVTWEESGSEATAYAIADNRTAELSTWDFQVLARQLEALRDEGEDLAALGWAPHELEPILQADWAPPDAKGSLESHKGQAKSIIVTHDQREVFERAYERMREENGDISEGRCVELLSADYLAG